MVVFRKEVAQSSNFTPPKTTFGKPRVKRENVRLLMSLFESLDHYSFFKNWENLIPEQIKEKSEYKKITIYLFAFFVTLPFTERQNSDKSTENPSSVVIDSMDKVTNLNGTFVLEKPSFEKMLFIESNEETPTHKSDHRYETDSLNSKSNTPEGETLEESTSAMAIFKQFLLDHGSEFTNEPELLPYFALPFVENPRRHPTFTRIFEKEWSDNLKQSLRAFLVKYSCGATVVPDMVRMCVLQRAQPRNGDHCKQLKIGDLKDDPRDQLLLKDLKRKLHTLKRDHQKLVGVATELATALEKCVQGEAVDLNYVLSNCVTIFPDLFSPAPLALEKATKQSKPHESFKSNELKLDAAKIKNSLLQGSIKVQLLLLQALRWRITRSTSTKERLIFLDWFCKTDILGLSKGLFSRLLLQPFESPHPLQQSLARLTYALVTTTVGRSYLTSSLQAIESLMDFAQDRNLDDVTEEMLAGIFYQISNSQGMHEVMVASNIIGWIETSLEKQLKAKAIERIILLLNNLTLKVSPDYWENHGKLADAVLRLVKRPQGEIATFACFALGNILMNDSLNEYFRNKNLETTLKDLLIQTQDDPLARKVEELIKFHNREISAYTQFRNSLEQDADKMDSDIDNDDLVKGSSGVDFLKEQYSIDDDIR